MVCWQAVPGVVNLSLNKSLILEASWSDVCPVQKFVHNTETCFLITRTLRHFVAVICSTGLSDQGRDVLPLLIEHLLMKCQLGSTPLPFKFSSQALSLLMGVHHGALGLITSLAFFIGACISKNWLSWSLYWEWLADWRHLQNHELALNFGGPHPIADGWLISVCDTAQILWVVAAFLHSGWNEWQSDLIGAIPLKDCWLCCHPSS